METLYKNPLYSEHLKKGVKPIIACLGTFRDFEMSHDYASKILLSESCNLFDITQHYDGVPLKVEDIDYFAKPEDGKNIDSKTGGQYTYIISSISSCNKLTRYLYDCTSLIVAGKEKRTGQELSFLSHQDPFQFLQKGRVRGLFILHLMESLWKMKKVCEEGTIDIVIAGGNYFLDDPCNSYDPKEVKESKETYKKSISFLSRVVSKFFDFEPVVIVGPKTTDRSDAILYVNNERRLYITRPETGNATTESFLPQDILIQEGKW